MGAFSLGLIVCWYYFLNVANLQELTVPNSRTFIQIDQQEVLTRRPGIIACSEKNVNCVSPSGDNVIVTFTAGMSEEECQALCRNEDDCQAYTYYAHETPNKCYLLNKCSRGYCTHCHSGPKECFCDKPDNTNDGGYWNCNFTPDLNQDWKNQYTDCDLICSSMGTSDHIDCKDQQWNPPAENFHCEPEPPETESCHGAKVPHVPNGSWNCYDEGISCTNHCILQCDNGYNARGKDTLECDYRTCCHCQWCAFDSETSGTVGIECSCNGCEWYEPGQDTFECIKSGCDQRFPDGSTYDADSWSCMADGNPISDPDNLGPGTECKRRCGQGQNSMCSYKCDHEGNWIGTASTNSTCVNDEEALLYFFTSTGEGNYYTKNIENPPDSNIINSDGEFTSKTNGLHLFTLVKGRGGLGDIQLKHNEEIIATIPKDDTKTNSLAVAVDLAINDKVKVEVDGDLTFTGVSLYSPRNKTDSKYLWGSGIQMLDVQNMDQPIILKDVNHGDGVDYDKNTGYIKIERAGVYMMSLNLGSDDSSYASLDINNIKTLGLGEDRDGRNVMSNFILKEFQAGDTIKPTLEALSKLNYDDNKQTQFVVASLINEVKDLSFCAYSSHYKESSIFDTVIFDQMFLQNGNFDKTTGIFTLPYEEFNPKRFYLLSATAFMGKLKNSNFAELKIEQEKEHGFISIASATTSSSMRSMLQITVIAQMDQNANKLRVQAIGFMDEGPDVNFTTFCGFRLDG